MAEDKELINRIKTHFSNQERIHFFVQEWDQDIYMTPLSLREQDKINARAKDSPYQLAVYALIMKAEDEQGEKLFSLDDKVDLLNNVSFGTVEKIITGMFSSGSVEDAEKKLIQDTGMFSRFFVAEQLGKTMNEIIDVSVSEFMHWLAYFKIQNEKHK